MITTCLHTGQGSVIVVNHKVYMMMSLMVCYANLDNTDKFIKMKKKKTTSSDSVADH